MEDKINQKAQTKAQKEFEKLNAIREIIFGQNIEEYNEEFKQIHNQIEKTSADLNQNIEALRKEILTRMDEMEIKFNNRLDDLEKDLQHKINTLDQDKLDRAQFSSLLQEMAKKISG